MDRISNDNICRICLNVQDTLFSLYRKHHGTSPYEKLIRKTLLNIQLNDSGPPSICSQCLIDLDTTVSFLDKCERSNRQLGAWFAQSLDESSNKAETLEIDSELKVILEEPQDENEGDNTEAKLSAAVLLDEQCGECGSKRRCKHWAPPSVRTCQFCNKTFNKKYNYKLHVQRHLGADASEFECAGCSARLGSRWAARRHCAPRPRRACPAPRCGKTFTTNTNLRIHSRTHSGERPFECDDCGKAFISKNILNNHMRIHTGVKPYMCQICGKQFATNKLSRHMLSHAQGPPSPSPRAHACPHGGCARSFPSARALRSHARSHALLRAHACALCDTRYKFKQSLNYHVKNAHGVGAKTVVRAEASPVTAMPANCNEL